MSDDNKLIPWIIILLLVVVIVQQAFILSDVRGLKNFFFPKAEPIKFNFVDPLTYGIVYDGEPILGDRTTTSVVALYVDYNSPELKKFWEEEYPKFHRKYIETNETAFIIKQMPDSNNSDSIWKAVFAKCAEDSGRFWQANDLLIRSQGKELDIDKMLKEIGVSEADFDKRCNFYKDGYIDQDVLSVWMKGLDSSRKDINFKRHPTLYYGYMSGGFMLSEKLEDPNFELLDWKVSDLITKVDNTIKK